METTPKAPSGKGSEIKAKASVVIVDDMRTNLEILKRRLQAEPINVQTFTSAVDCANALDSLEADLFILDIEMPDLTGFQLAEKIKAHPRHRKTPFMFFTGMDSDATLAQAFALGAIDFLPKKMGELEVRLRVRNALSLAQYQEQLAKQSETLEVYLRLIFHDLASPLTYAFFHAEKLKEEIKDEKQIGRLTKMAGALERVRAMTSDLRDLFRGDLESTTSLPSDVLTDLLHSYETPLEKKSLRLDMQIPRENDFKFGIPRTFLAHQILGNLISNAIKFSDPESAIEVLLGTPFEAQGKQWTTVKIRDFGKGMTPDRIQSFKSRRPGASSRGTSGESGTGSGGMIAHYFLDKFGGTMDVESFLEPTPTEPRGTRLILTLPVQPL